MVVDHVGLGAVAEALLEFVPGGTTQCCCLIAGYADDFGGAVLMDGSPDHHGEQPDSVVGDGGGEPAVQDRQETSTCRRGVRVGAVAD